MTTAIEKSVGATLWTPERRELVKRQVCPKGITDDEFAVFMEQCVRSGLDPLVGQAFCVARRTNTGSRERPNWTTIHVFQPSEAGFLARAERFPDFQGVQAMAVYAEDTIEVDAPEGKVVHKFNPAKRKGSLAGAWVRVLREGKLPVVLWLDLAGYVQQSPLWSKIPATMIEKCARVAGLRKAYPEAFGGLYTKEERPDEEQDDAVEGELVVPQTSAPPPPPAKERKAKPAAALPPATSTERLPAPAAQDAVPARTRATEDAQVEPTPLEQLRAVDPVVAQKLEAVRDAALAEAREAPVATPAPAPDEKLALQADVFIGEIAAASTDAELNALTKRILESMPKGTERTRVGDTLNARRKAIRGAR